MTDSLPGDNPEEIDAWVKEQLSARGLNPESLSVDQMLALMQEAVETIVRNLQIASSEAGDLSAKPELDALLDQAEQLKQDLDKLHGELGKHE